MKNKGLLKYNRCVFPPSHNTWWIFNSRVDHPPYESIDYELVINRFPSQYHNKGPAYHTECSVRTPQRQKKKVKLGFSNFAFIDNLQYVYFNVNRSHFLNLHHWNKNKIGRPNCSVPFPYSPSENILNLVSPPVLPSLYLDVICL